LRNSGDSITPPLAGGVERRQVVIRKGDNSMKWNSPEGRFTVGFHAAFWACIAIVTLLVTGEMRPVWEWLDKWQTLIAGALAVGAAFFTIREAQRSNRLVVDLEEKRLLAEIWKKIDFAQAVRLDLVMLIRSYQKVLDDYRAGKPVLRARMGLLDIAGTNIPVDHSPLIHGLVRRAWEGAESDRQNANTINPGQFMTAQDAKNIQVAISEVNTAIWHIEKQYVDAMIPALEEKGFRIYQDQNGLYRWEKT
jgi:hypothetical protein